MGRTPARPRVAITLAALTFVAACSSDDDRTDSTASGSATTTAPPTTGAPPSTEPSTTARSSTTTPPVTEAPAESAVATTEADAGAEGTFTAVELVEVLADDSFNGRDNLTRESRKVQDLLVRQLEGLAEPAYPGTPDGYLQPFGQGTNVVGVIPGDDLADEYVVLGAHYDHLRDCRGITAEDDVCNGAADNASGVAAVLDVARSITDGGPPRRSVVLALWDAEEDGLLGSTAYAADPVVPLDRTVAHVNWDMQGANLLPSLAETTLLIGAETGGDVFVSAAEDAAAVGGLDTILLSRVFGQDRSDHVVFAEAGIPVAFFTDATNGCYHSVGDDVEHFDFAKFERQLVTARALVAELVSADEPPRFDAPAPTATYDDAVGLLTLVETAEPDLGLLPDVARGTAEQFLGDLRQIVEAGPEMIDDAAVGVLLAGAAVLIDILVDLPCDLARS